MLSRGFIGPIGDDLPSLIPILFGLVMFFSTFTVAFDAYDKRNQGFTDDIAVMRIARTMQSSSYIYSHDNFEDLCADIGIVSLKYVVVLSQDAQNGANPENIFDVSVFSDFEGAQFYCTNVDSPSSTEKISGFLSVSEASDYRVVTRIYPVALEDDRIVKPMHLFVVAWK